MTTKQFESWLADALEAHRADAGPGDPIRRVETYEEAGVLTTDPGLVVGFWDGSEVQVTIVRSRRCSDGSHPDEEPHDDDQDDDDDGTFEHAARVNGIR